MNIAFRLDSDTIIGSGHLVRCLTLADRLRQLGAQCHFICRSRPNNLNHLVMAHGFRLTELAPVGSPAPHPLPDSAPSLPETPFSNSLQTRTYELRLRSSWLGANWHDDADQTLQALEQAAASTLVPTADPTAASSLEPGQFRQTRPFDWLVVDHYGIDGRWHRQLRRLCERILVIDDLADRNHDCDLLLDQNLVARFQTRYDCRVPAHCRKLLGPTYALLQPAYRSARAQTGPRTPPIQRILIYFGAADQHNLTGQSLAAIQSLACAELVVDVILSANSPQVSSLRQLAAKNLWIVLHESIPTLAPLMRQADLAIGASGATTWERCCLGLPSLVVTLASNQVPIARELSRLGIVQWLGDSSNVTIEQIADALAATLELGATPSLTDWSSRCFSLVDGCGTDRVAQAMLRV